MTLHKKESGTVIHSEFSCDVKGCKVRTPSAASHTAVLPGDWGSVLFLARDKNEECHAEAHLCPGHAEVIGRQLARWTVSGQNVEEPPERFR